MSSVPARPAQGPVAPAFSNPRSAPIRTFLTGVSGFIGSHLAHALIERGHTVVGTARRATAELPEHPRFRFVPADTTRPGPWQAELQTVDTIVNLAGRSISGRWTEKVKAEIRDSRILTTRRLVEGVPEGRPVTLISASGVGYYGSRGDDVLTESEPPGEDFLARLTIDWEAAALEGRAKGLRVAVLRLGVVLARGGGALAQMVPAFRLFAGGPLGSGRQWFPWIHRDDLISAILFLAGRPDLSGVFNACAPEPVRNRDFAAALGRELKRPAFMTAPAFVLQVVLGEFAQVLLASQRAVPQRLRAYGFDFDYPEVGATLHAILAPGDARESG